MPLRRQPFRQLTPGWERFIARRMPPGTRIAPRAARSTRPAACHIIAIPFPALHQRTRQTLVHAHRCGNPFIATFSDRSRISRPAAARYRSTTLTIRQRRVSLVGRRRVSLVGRRRVPLVGPHQVPLVGRHRVLLVGRHRVSLVGRHRVLLVGRHRVSLVGRHRVSLVGRHHVSLVGRHHVPLAGQRRVPVAPRR